MSQSALNPIHTLSGTSIPVVGNDIDTDRIIPARFLKCVTFDTLGPHAFEDDRLALASQGKVHSFDQEKYKGASILFVNKNFGCGSSREHAPQSLKRWGITAIVGESFAEIFYGNCVSLGIPCVQLNESDLAEIQTLSSAQPQTVWTLNIKNATLEGPKNFAVQIKPSAQQQFVEGSWNPAYDLLKNLEKVHKLAATLPY